jgi:diadenosine tetraphosphate (Ap4A) HIT family hydrolase
MFDNRYSTPLVSVVNYTRVIQRWLAGIFNILSPHNLTRFGPDTQSGRRVSDDAWANCRFCREVSNKRYEYASGSVVALPDAFPVTDGHILVLPVRHTNDFFSMTPMEHRDAEHLLLSLRDIIQQRDPTVSGFNIGMNCGHVAGQTIDHAHFHLIPRRKGDTAAPSGGVRGVIPERMSYERPETGARSVLPIQESAHEGRSERVVERPILEAWLYRE